MGPTGSTCGMCWCRSDAPVNGATAAALPDNGEALRQAFDDAGFARVQGMLTDAACQAVAARADPGTRSGGTRSLLAEAWCADLVRHLRAHASLAGLLPAGHVAVQCTYFEKSASRNWLVPVHQDLSIPVQCRVDDPALRGWSEKEGQWFVQAPGEVLAQLVAVRVHLDDCGEDDGPLRVVPASHRRGVLSPEAARIARQHAGEVVCTSPRGGALVMRPLLLHASSKSTGHSQRRVLHFVFGPPWLPHGLTWQHSA